MSSCPACGKHVNATAKFCRMCGHRLAATRASAAKSELPPSGEPGAHDEAYEDSATLSFVSDPPGAPVDAGSAVGGGTRASTSVTEAAADPVCEICGRTASEGESLCSACAQLTASSEPDDG
jgi:hypothetical protein